MKRILVLIVVVFSVAISAAGQKQPSDSETLQSLLNEVRQLRRDLQTTSVAAQRVQIVLYRLEGQRAAIARAAQSLQSARLELASVQKDRQETARNLKLTEEERDRNPNASERTGLESFISQAKNKLERLAAEEDQKRLQVQAMETQLQSEQEKLEALHRVLDQLDASLAGVGR
jgi:chromosome segregation ATPase